MLNWYPNELFLIRPKLKKYFKSIQIIDIEYKILEGSRRIPWNNENSCRWIIGRAKEKLGRAFKQGVSFYGLFKQNAKMNINFNFYSLLLIKNIKNSI
jgi:hypothetical protein